MPLFRGSKNATIVNGEIVATAQDIADAVNDAIAAKNAAEAAEASALNTLDNFDDRYLGAKSSDPTVDNDGDALIDGALYYNTVNLITRVYDLSSDSWSDLKPSATEQANINALGPVASQVEIVGDNISDVSTVSADLSGADTVGIVAGSIANVNATGTDIANVNTVAGELGAGQDVTVVAADLSGTDTVGIVAGSIGDVSTVATDLSGTDTIGTVSTNIANVNTVAGIDTDVTTVAGISSDVTTVAADGVDIGTVATNIADVNTTATNISDVQIVANDLNETVSDIETVSTNITNVNNVGGNIANVNTVSDISTEVTIVAADGTDIGDVASNINAVDVVASDLAGAGFDYDLGSITGVTEGVVGTPDGFIITVFNIRDDIQAVAAVADDVSALARSDQEVRDLFSSAGDLSYNSSTGQFSVTTYKSSDFDTDFTSKSTSDLSEGTNLYYTDARARASVSASGSLSYDQNTGVFSYTERTDSQIRGLFSSGGDLSYNATTGEFSVTTYKSSDFDTDFASKTTSDLTEGTNLYYTDARVNADIDARVDKTFVDALNVDADTLDGQDGAHYLDRANHTGTQTLSTISDSGALAALDTVDTAQIANQAVTDDKLATSLDLGSI